MGQLSAARGEAFCRSNVRRISGHVAPTKAALSLDSNAVTVFVGRPRQTFPRRACENSGRHGPGRKVRRDSRSRSLDGFESCRQGEFAHSAISWCLLRCSRCPVILRTHSRNRAYAITAGCSLLPPRGTHPPREPFYFF